MSFDGKEKSLKLLNVHWFLHSIKDVVEEVPRNVHLLRMKPKSFFLTQPPLSTPPVLNSVYLTMFMIRRLNLV